MEKLFNVKLTQEQLVDVMSRMMYEIGKIDHEKYTGNEELRLFNLKEKEMLSSIVMACQVAFAESLNGNDNE